MYSKHNDKQIGNDQSFCSYCGNNSRLIAQEYRLKDQEVYTKKNKKVFIILGIIIFIVLLIVLF